MLWTRRIWSVWQKDGRYSVRRAQACSIQITIKSLTDDPFPPPDTVLNHPRIVGLPLLLLANKQDLPNSLTVEQIRENYEEWWQLRNQEHAHRLGKQRVDERRMASLDVIGVSALDG